MKPASDPHGDTLFFVHLILSAATVVGSVFALFAVLATGASQ